jgi:energy-coupling factor transporter ATP-binding protein EcfA2
VLNDQFRGSEAWDAYLSRIESANPTVEALGVTDYWSLDRYGDVVAYKSQGRLRDVELVFPNVEIRFNVGTDRAAPINAHLLISPEDSDHIARARALLARLTFRAYNETFRCTPDELIRLGRAHDASAVDDQAAHRVGTNQFKVTVDDLRNAFDGSEWARKNVLVAVAAGSGDGSSGLRRDAALSAVRTEIERTADIIFSGTPGDREFWIGRKSLSIEQLIQSYDGAKPCMHGSDAHQLEIVCAPNLDRFTWIKGDATFESLRQACIEPEARVFIGQSPPEGALPYQVIESIELGHTRWFKPRRIELNPGLVGIIGARGSGKTALADLVATAAGSPESHDNPRSFVRRAAEHLAGVEVTLTWRDGERTTTGLLSDGLDGGSGHVQYLSQQFVERLCSSDGGVTDELLAEIERVIFDEHAGEDRLGATTFTELRELKASRSRSAQTRSREGLERAVEEISEERRKHASLTLLKRQFGAADEAIAIDKRARETLLGEGIAEGRTRRLSEIRDAIDARQRRRDSAARRQQALAALRDVVTDVRVRVAKQEVSDLSRAHGAAGLSEDDWNEFERLFRGDVDAVLKSHADAAARLVTELAGPRVPDHDDAVPYVAEDADLGQAPLEALVKEGERLRKLIGIDQRKAEQLKELDRKIARAETALVDLRVRLEDALKASTRIDALKERRKEQYAKIFDALLDEEDQLIKLYAPLAATLKSAEGALGELSFTVRRHVDVGRWAAAGEELLDLRTAGPFRGQGSLLETAREELLPAWQTGGSTDVAAAMATFRDKHDRALLEHSPYSVSDGERYWAWAARIANWLDSTDHVTITYGVQYDGVDIEQLSPGTRGIMLLLLYLSVDRNDTRPLIIDQPEENLDPKSVFDELVTRFREARLRRQVIIVTHNANLVVNTDADQVIVASAGPHRRGELPEITYTAGGLENATIRRLVCEILEGGEQAFVERARRLRVRLPR